MNRIDEIRAELYRMECAYDNLHTDSELAGAYKALQAELTSLEPAPVTPTLETELRMQLAWAAQCRRAIRHYTKRIRDGGCRMNLTYDMRPHLKDYRHTMRMVSKLKQAVA